VLRPSPEHQLQCCQVPVFYRTVLGKIRSGVAQGRRQNLHRRIQSDLRRAGQQNLCLCAGENDLKVVVFVVFVIVVVVIINVVVEIVAVISVVLKLEYKLMTV
jgi:hypothetical protein